MSCRSREYWETMVEEFEEVVVSEISEEYYDDDKVPDLEELVIQCPYEDLSERLLMYAKVIECRTIEREEVEKVVCKNYLELCFDF